MEILHYCYVIGLLLGAIQTGQSHSPTTTTKKSQRYVHPHKKYILKKVNVGTKKNTISEPIDEIILRDDDSEYIEGDEDASKRDILILPDTSPNLSTQQVLQTIQNALSQNENQEANQKPVISVVAGNRRDGGMFFDSSLAKNQEESFDMQPTSLYESDPLNQFTQGGEPLSSNPTGSVTKPYYDEYFPEEYKSAQGLQDSEEKLIGKLIINPPSGASTKWGSNKDMEPTPSRWSGTKDMQTTHVHEEDSHKGFSDRYNDVINSILLDKALEQAKEKQKKSSADCSPVPLSHIENCKNSTDSHCKDDDINAFRKNGLYAHQEFRNIHHTPQVELNEKLNEGAQEYADKLAFADKLSYSDPKDRPGQGENIAVRCSDDGSMLTAKEAVSYWYHKICQDTTSMRSYTPEIGQFSQIVWKETNFIGMGRAKREKGDLTCTYVVARYSPQATKSGFLENVPRGEFYGEQACPMVCKNGTEKAKEAENPSTAAATASNKISEETSAQRNLAEATTSLFNKMKFVTDTARNESDARIKAGTSTTNASMQVVHNGNVIVPSSLKEKSKNVSLSARSNTEQIDDEADEHENPALITHPTEENPNLPYEHDSNTGLAKKKYNSTKGTRERSKQFNGEKGLNKPTDIKQKHLDNTFNLKEKSMQNLKTQKGLNSVKNTNMFLQKSEATRINTLQTPTSGVKTNRNKSSQSINYKNPMPNKLLKINDGRNHMSNKTKNVSPKLYNIDTTFQGSNLSNKTSANVTKGFKQSSKSLSSSSFSNKTANITKGFSQSNKNVSLEPPLSNEAIGDKQWPGKLIETQHPGSILENNAGKAQLNVTSISSISKTTTEPNNNETPKLGIVMDPMVGLTKPSVNNNPDIVIYINKHNDEDLKSSNVRTKGLTDYNKPTVKVSSFKGLHGENLTVVEKDPLTSHTRNGEMTNDVLQSFLTDLTRNYHGSSPTVATPTPSFIQLIPSSELEDFRHGMLEEHNKYRSLHFSPPLQLDSQLNKDAQVYAAHVAKHSTVAHSLLASRPNTGESVAELCTKEGVLPTPEHVVRKWYSEICSPGYDFNKRDKQPGTGHFTQLVWKDTERLGIGLAVSNHANGDSCSYVVARYQNAGNYLDRFEDNVLHGSFDERSSCHGNRPAVTKSDIKFYKRISPTIMSENKSLEEINKDFTTKYLSQGQNYFRDDKIYHFGYPKNFSFTPSKSWLENYKRRKTSRNTSKLELEDIIGDPHVSETISRFSKPVKHAKFRVRIDPDETTVEENDDSFLSRRKKDKLSRIDHALTQNTKADNQPENLRPTEESSLILKRRRRSTDNDTIPNSIDANETTSALVRNNSTLINNNTLTNLTTNNLHPLINLTNNNTLLSNNSGLMEQRKNEESKQNMTQLLNEFLEKSSLVSNDTSTASNMFLNTTNGTDVDVGKNNTNMLQHLEAKSDLDTTQPTAFDKPVLNAALFSDVPYANGMAERNTAYVSNKNESKISTKPENTYTANTIKKQFIDYGNNSIGSDFDNMEFNEMNTDDEGEEELVDIFEERFKSNRLKKPKSRNQTKSFTEVVNKQPVKTNLKVEVDKARNSNFHPKIIQGGTKKIKHHPINSSNVKKSRQNKLSREKKRSPKLNRNVRKNSPTKSVQLLRKNTAKHSKSKKSHSKSSHNIFMYHSQPRLSNSAIRAMHKLINITENENDLVQFLSTIVHKINTIDKNTRRNQKQFDDEIVRFAALNHETINSTSHNVSTGPLFTKHSNVEASVSSSLAKLEKLEKDMKHEENYGDIQNQLRRDMRTFIQKLKKAVIKNSITENQKRQMLGKIKQIKYLGDTGSLKEVNEIGYGSNLFIKSPDKAMKTSFDGIIRRNQNTDGISSRKNGDISMKEKVAPFIIKGESDGPDEYSITESSVDEGPTEEASGNVEDGLLSANKDLKQHQSQNHVHQRSQSLLKHRLPSTSRTKIHKHSLQIKDVVSRPSSHEDVREKSQMTKKTTVGRINQSDTNLEAATSLLMKAASVNHFSEERTEPNIEDFKNAATKLMLQTAQNVETHKEFLGSSNPYVGLSQTDTGTTRRFDQIEKNDTSSTNMPTSGSIEKSLKNSKQEEILGSLPINSSTSALSAFEDITPPEESAEENQDLYEKNEKEEMKNKEQEDEERPDQKNGNEKEDKESGEMKPNHQKEPEYKEKQEESHNNNNNAISKNQSKNVSKDQESQEKTENNEQVPKYSSQNENADHKEADGKPDKNDENKYEKSSANNNDNEENSNIDIEENVSKDTKEEEDDSGPVELRLKYKQVKEEKQKEEKLNKADNKQRQQQQDDSEENKNIDQTHEESNNKGGKQLGKGETESKRKPSNGKAEKFQNAIDHTAKSTDDSKQNTDQNSFKEGEKLNSYDENNDDKTEHGDTIENNSKDNREKSNSRNDKETQQGSKYDDDRETSDQVMKYRPSKQQKAGESSAVKETDDITKQKNEDSNSENAHKNLKEESYSGSKGSDSNGKSEDNENNSSLDENNKKETGDDKSSKDSKDDGQQQSTKLFFSTSYYSKDAKNSPEKVKTGSSNPNNKEDSDSKYTTENNRKGKHKEDYEKGGDENKNGQASNSSRIQSSNSNKYKSYGQDDKTDSSELQSNANSNSYKNHNKSDPNSQDQQSFNSDAGDTSGQKTSEQNYSNKQNEKVGSGNNRTTQNYSKNKMKSNNFNTNNGSYKVYQGYYQIQESGEDTGKSKDNENTGQSKHSGNQNEKLENKNSSSSQYYSQNRKLEKEGTENNVNESSYKTFKESSESESSTADKEKFEEKLQQQKNSKDRYNSHDVNEKNNSSSSENAKSQDVDKSKTSQTQDSNQRLDSQKDKESDFEKSDKSNKTYEGSRNSNENEAQEQENSKEKLHQSNQYSQREDPKNNKESKLEEINKSNKTQNSSVKLESDKKIQQQSQQYKEKGKNINSKEKEGPNQKEESTEKYGSRIENSNKGKEHYSQDEQEGNTEVAKGKESAQYDHGKESSQENGVADMENKETSKELKESSQTDNNKEQFNMKETNQMGTDEKEGKEMDSKESTKEKASANPALNEAALHEKVKGMKFPNSFVSEIVSKVSEEADESGLEHPLTQAKEPTLTAPDELEHSALIAHNKFRSIHHAPMLAFSPSLSQDAQKYAEQLITVHGGNLVESMPKTRPDQGENLYMDCDARGLGRSGIHATNKWYKEICEQGYNFDAEPIVTKGIDHFTQVVWKSTRFLGIGRVMTRRNKMTCTIIVARYKPVGNIPKQFKANVLEGAFNGDICENLKHDIFEGPAPCLGDPAACSDSDVHLVTRPLSGINIKFPIMSSSHPITSSAHPIASLSHPIPSSTHPFLSSTHFNGVNLNHYQSSQENIGIHKGNGPSLGSSPTKPIHVYETQVKHVFDIPREIQAQYSTTVKKIFTPRYHRKKENENADKKSKSRVSKKLAKMTKLTGKKASNNSKYQFQPTKHSVLPERVKNEKAAAQNVVLAGINQDEVQEMHISEHDNLNGVQRVIDQHPVHININPKPIDIWPSETNDVDDKKSTKENFNFENTSYNIGGIEENGKDKEFEKGFTKSSVESYVKKRNENLVSALERQALETTLKNFGPANLDTLNDNTEDSQANIHGSKNHNEYDLDDDDSKRIAKLVGYENRDSEEEGSMSTYAGKKKQKTSRQSRRPSVGTEIKTNRATSSEDDKNFRNIKEKFSNDDNENAKEIEYQLGNTILQNEDKEAELTSTEEFRSESKTDQQKPQEDFKIEKMDDRNVDSDKIGKLYKEIKQTTNGQNTDVDPGEHNEEISNRTTKHYKKIREEDNHNDMTPKGHNQNNEKMKSNEKLKQVSQENKELDHETPREHENMGDGLTENDGKEDVNSKVNEKKPSKTIKGNENRKGSNKYTSSNNLLEEYDEKTSNMAQTSKGNSDKDQDKNMSKYPKESEEFTKIEQESEGQKEERNDKDIKMDDKESSERLENNRQNKNEEMQKNGNENERLEENNRQNNKEDKQKYGNENERLEENNRQNNKEEKQKYGKESERLEEDDKEKASVYGYKAKLKPPGNPRPLKTLKVGKEGEASEYTKDENRNENEKQESSEEDHHEEEASNKLDTFKNLHSAEDEESKHNTKDEEMSSGNSQSKDAKDAGKLKDTKENREDQNEDKKKVEEENGSSSEQNNGKESKHESPEDIKDNKENAGAPKMNKDTSDASPSNGPSEYNKHVASNADKQTSESVKEEEKFSSSSTYVKPESADSDKEMSSPKLKPSKLKEEPPTSDQNKVPLPSDELSEESQHHHDPQSLLMDDTEGKPLPPPSPAWFKLPLANTQPSPQEAQVLLHGAGKLALHPPNFAENHHPIDEKLTPVGGVNSVHIGDKTGSPPHDSELGDIHNTHKEATFQHGENRPQHIHDQNLPLESGSFHDTNGINALEIEAMKHPGDQHLGSFDPQSNLNAQPPNTLPEHLPALHGEHSDNVDNGMTVAPVNEHHGVHQHAVGPGLLPTFRFASFGSPVILHIGATGFFEDPASFLKTALTVHNEFRAKHGSPPLQIDPMLTMQAFQHAELLSSAGYLKHPPSKALGGTGENLLLGCYDGDYDISAEEAVLRWYAEVCNPGYGFDEDTVSSGTGHFTQVVWIGSTKLGMAKVTRMQNGLRCTYIVARYAPAGNKNTGFKENVKKGKFKEKEVCANVFKRLLGFEERNMAKVKMVEKEKQLARLEFLEKLKEGEEQLMKEIEDHDQKNSQEADPWKEPPIMHSEYHSDGGNLNQNVHHDDRLMPTQNPQDGGIIQQSHGEQLNQTHNSEVFYGHGHEIENEIKEAMALDLKTPFTHNGAGPIPDHFDTSESKHLSFNNHNERHHDDNVIATNTTSNIKPKPIKSPAHSSHLTNKEIDEAGKQVNSSEDKPSTKPERTNAEDIHFTSSLNTQQVTPEAIDLKEMEKSSHEPIDPTIQPFKPMGDFNGADLGAGTSYDPLYTTENLATSSSPLGLIGNSVSHLYTGTAYSGTVAEHSNSNEKNAVVEINLPNGSSSSDNSVSSTEKVNDNVLENLEAQKSLSENSDEELKDIKDSAKDTDIKLADEQLTKLIDLDDSTSTKSSAEEFVTNNLPSKGKSEFLSKSDDKFMSELEEVTKLLDASGSQSSKEKNFKLINDKLLKNGKMKDADIASLLREEDKELSAEITKLQGTNNLEFNKDSNGPEKDEEENSDSSKRHMKKPRRTGPRKKGVLPDAPIPSKKSSYKKHSQSLSHRHDGLNSEDEAMIHSMLAKTQSFSIQSEFDDALQNEGPSVVGPVASRGKIKHQKSLKIGSSKSHKNDDLVPDPFEILEPPKNPENNKSKGEKINEPPLKDNGQKGNKEDREEQDIELLKLKLKNSSNQRESDIKQANKMGRQHPQTKKLGVIKQNSFKTPEKHEKQHDWFLIPSILTNTPKKPLKNQASKLKNKTKTDDISLFEIDALKAHNVYRHTHGARSMRLNRQMSDEATKYAREISKLGTLQHSNTDDGENIATVCRDNNNLMTGPEASEIWYREVCDPGYDFIAAQPGNAGHFSQVVWKASKEFGIGRAAAMHDGLLCTYIVARYRPAGNFLGEFRDNVQEGFFTASKCLNFARNQISRQSQFPLKTMFPIAQPFVSMPLFKRSGIPKVRSTRSINEDEEDWSRSVASKNLNEQKSHQKIIKVEQQRNVQPQFYSNPTVTRYYKQSQYEVQKHPTRPRFYQQQRPIQQQQQQVKKQFQNQLASNSLLKTKSHHKEKHHKKHHKIHAKYHHKHHHHHHHHRHHHRHHNKHKHFAGEIQHHNKTYAVDTPYSKFQYSYLPSVSQKLINDKINFLQNTKFAPLGILRSQPVSQIGAVKSEIKTPTISDLSNKTHLPTIQISRNNGGMFPTIQNNLDVYNTQVHYGNKTFTNDRGDRESQFISSQEGIDTSNNFRKSMNTEAKTEKENVNVDGKPTEKSNFTVFYQNYRQPREWEHVHNNSYKENEKTTIATVNSFPSSTNETGLNNDMKFIPGNSTTQKSIGIPLHDQAVLNETQDLINNTNARLTAENDLVNLENSSNFVNSTGLSIMESNATTNKSVSKDAVDNISVYRNLNQTTGQAMNHSLPADPETMGNETSSHPVYMNATLKNSSNPTNTTLTKYNLNTLDSRDNEKYEDIVNNSSNSETLRIPTQIRANISPTSKINNASEEILDTAAYTKDMIQGSKHMKKKYKQKKGKKNENEVLLTPTPTEFQSFKKLVTESPLNLSELENQVLSQKSEDKDEKSQLRSMIERDDKYINQVDELIEDKLKHKSVVIVPQSKVDRVNCLNHGELNCTYVIENANEKNSDLRPTENSRKPIQPVYGESEKKATVETTGILNRNDAALSIAQKLAKELIPQNKINNIDEMSSLRPPEESTQRNILGSPQKMVSLDNMETILKMAKIGTIALKLAKKKSLERKIQEEVNEDSLHDKNVLGVIGEVKKGTKEGKTVASSLDLFKEFYPTQINPMEDAIVKNSPLLTPAVFAEMPSPPVAVSNTAIDGDTILSFSQTPLISEKVLYSDPVLRNLESVASSLKENKENEAKNKITGETFDMESLNKDDENGNNQEFIEAALNVHNTYRYVHNVEPLLFDKDLMERAQIRASHLAREGGLQVAKRNMDSDGENIAMVCKTTDSQDKLTGPDATRIWYNQVCSPKYVFGVDRKQDDADKFIQVVWKDTKRFGIGRSAFVKDGRFCTIVVARYSPAARADDSPSANVLPGSFDYGSYCNGLGKSSDVLEETANTRNAIKLASGNSQDFRLEALNLQNQFRSIHNAPAIELDDTMCVQAEQFATQMAKDGSVKRNNVLEDGENAMKSCNTNNVEVSADEAVRKWYNEVCNPGYSFLKGDTPGGVNSFTQMIWKPTKRFGIGKATTREDGMFCTYIVALYREKGNIHNEYQSNVLKGAFDFGYCESLGKQHRPSYERYQRHFIQPVGSNSPEKLLTNFVNNSSSTSVRNSEKTEISNPKTSKKNIPKSNTKDNKSNVASPIKSQHDKHLQGKTTKSDIHSSNSVLLKSHGSLKNGKSDSQRLILSGPPINFFTNDSRSKRNRIPLKRKKNSKKTKKKKLIIDNLMQLNDFVMSENIKVKDNKTKLKNKSRYNHSNHGKKT